VHPHQKIYGCGYIGFGSYTDFKHFSYLLCLHSNNYVRPAPAQDGSHEARNGRTKGGAGHAAAYQSDGSPPSAA